MEEHELLVVKWVNDLLGGRFAVPPHVVMQTIILIGLIVIFAILRTHFSVESPGRLQQALELFVEFVNEQLESNIGHEGHRYLGIVGTLAVFIISCNLLGLIPGLMSPTSNFNVPAGCAVIVFLYYQAEGVRKQGLVKYIRHFMGPVLALFWLIMPIEIISHLARPLTLTMRLFANIMAEELVITIFFGLFPLIVPLPFMAFAIFGGLLQAFIFCTLTMVYLGGAVATEEHH